MPVNDEQVFWSRIRDYHSLAFDFNELKKNKKIKASAGSINLPMQFCDLKVYDFPKGYMKKSSLDWEIHQNFIEDTSNYRFDHLETGKSEKGVYDILVSALSTVIDERATTMLAMGLKVVAVEPDIISLYNGLASLSKNLPAKTILLVDVSYPYSSFALVNNGVFMPGVSFKVGKNFLKEGILDILPGLALDIVKAFNRRFDLIGFDLVENKPELLIVSGGSVNEDIANFLSQELEMKPYLSNPVDRSPIKIKDRKSKVSWFSYIKALGLALRS